MAALDPYIVDLQLRFMRLERDVAELSGVVAAQQRTIEALKLEAERRRERDAGDAPAPDEERPPHY